MAEPLKNHYGPDVPVRIARMIKEVDSAFDEDAFLADSLENYQALELTPRALQIAQALGRHLPQDYERAIEILIASLGPKLEAAELKGMDVFIYLPHVFFVAKFGVDHFEASMRAQYELTQRFTAEYSIRVFLERYPQRTQVPWKGNLLTLRAAQARTSRRSPRSTYDPVSLPRRPCDART
jgi:3-methyladenine DNA glycosylase AlkC